MRPTPSPATAPATPAPNALSAAERRAQYLYFLLGQECFGLPIARVREIIEFSGVTELPMMPPYLRGVINLRGRVVPVIDLQARFGRGAMEAARRTSIVIVELGSSEGAPRDATLVVGVMVSAVTEVVELDASAVEPPPAFGAAIRVTFISGITRHRDRFVVLLDLDEVLSVEELSQLAETPASMAGA